ncbi:hypothetical protein ABU178_19545 [Pantoea osteomyelitidis]|uniref:PLD phosphodiesterase domain-containing protein n=1 Tax=Pantoea osteomyelitidis TaxID=3230026 RepID=A0ABW7Q4I5_9GAMM
MADRNRLPLSLADYFDAPEGYRGHFGWMCGFSADKPFLDSTMTRFSGLNHATRAHQGQCQLALFLDAGNRAITPVDVPGVAHCLLQAAPPLNLLHAKVAILGFKADDPEAGWRLRLLVSSGNWTEMTLQRSLDLVWCLDLSREALLTDAVAVQQSCADFNAAHNLLSDIATWCETSLLSLETHNLPTSGTLARQEVESWLAACRKRARGKPRLVDNRKRSLFSQLQSWLAQPSFTGKRNYLAMGSGFFEGGRQDVLVPQKIVQQLQASDQLTQSAEIDLFVNPQACQAVAHHLEALQSQRFTIRPPDQPTQPARFLHAKFIFSANQRAGSEMLNRTWLYMGSGNLTEPGFMQRMKQGAGNLEAGVLFTPGRLAKSHKGKLPPEQTLSWLLPVQSELNCDELQEPLAAGEEMAERPSHFAPPVAWLRWKTRDEGNHLLTSPDLPLTTIMVLNRDGMACRQTHEGVEWQGDMPRSVTIRWQSDHGEQCVSIPVIDELGRIAATPLWPLSLDEALWQLAHFPVAPDVEPSDEEEDLNLSAMPADEALSGGQRVDVHPIRQMMALIEGIADRQTQLAESDWRLWCRSLEQALIQASHHDDIVRFRDTGINPLSALREAAFRPVFAENDASEAGQNYLQMLDRVEHAWGVSALCSLTEVADV